MSVKYVGILGEIQEAYEKGWVEFHGDLPKRKYGIDIFEDILIDSYVPEYLLDLKIIEHASEDIGESVYVIFTWKGDHYRLNYNYRSHEGSSYYGNGRDVRKVTPKQVLKTIYE